MADYPWDYPICSLDRSKNDYNATPFEKSMSTSKERWRTIFDESTGHIIGYVRSSGGFTELVDRNGIRVYSTEIPIENSLFSPVDFLNFGTGKLAIGAVKLVARIGTTVGSSSSNAMKAALVKMKDIANLVRDKASKSLSQTIASSLSSTSKQIAKNLVHEIRQRGGKVRVNIGGNGEVPGAINLNPQVSQQVSGVENLIKEAGEKIGELFPSGSIDEIVSNGMIHGTIDWSKTLLGAIKVLRNGGKIKIAPFVGNITQHIYEIEAALLKAGFKEIKFFKSYLKEAEEKASALFIEALKK